ncbi:hypothetical protein Q4566_11470 [Tamlana sp. 2_MG-2023]|uniref:tetratricopeptide repeat protein n=1 Tax=unclassified Tamlana TaxID=2614803 RepID=UPI0026E45CE8|nr:MULTISPECIES: hypothetical protein [unclassified Tamlana]MDO6760821.1 hypothetical protein [Tamlana sp. 2_MG-2023]MDO6791077.1 hypothetical protein [Tamlana sp. 1_MG-2023]
MKNYFPNYFLIVCSFMFYVFGNHVSSAQQISFDNKDSSLVNDSLFFKTNDTLAIIDSHLEYSNRYKNNGQYTDAYDHLWKALVLANTKQLNSKLSLIHNELGLLYGIYGQDEQAIEHKEKALNIIKNSNIELKDLQLEQAYYSLAVQYRKEKKYKKALVYLDSCSIASEKQGIKTTENPYISAERGIIDLLKGDLVEAEFYLLNAKNLLEETNKHFSIIVYSFLGDLYSIKQDLTTAIFYYNKSLEGIIKYNSHTDFQVDVLRKMGELYKKQKDIDKAYYYLEASTKIADSLFSIRSMNNRKLFEIKNKYKETLAFKNRQILEQEVKLAKKTKTQTRLIFVLCISLILILVLIITYRYKTRIRKLKSEKEQAVIQEQHDKDKLQVVLETKSKELTVSALQLIEKDKKIEVLLNLLKDQSPTTYGRVKQEIMSGNKDLWENFNLRFTKVNVDFYRRLREKHASLTPTEQKHCALIKLKFDSKEMAHLLNISVNSVHISRHRIRKKIGLERGQDLTNYIASI